MTGANHVNFYLPGQLRQSAEAGEHNFIGKIESVLRDSGLGLSFKDPEAARASETGFSLFHMQEPLNSRGLTIRRNYYYPFWQIQRTNERWNWDVAQADFSKADIDRKEANRFYGFWQKRLYENLLSKVSKTGFIYVPLQGRLLERRSFQKCSPLDMIRHTLDQDSSRQVIATLHPKEQYFEEEIAALEKLEQGSDRLEIRFGEMEALLPHCDYIVTQNSSVAFAGFFLAKPCVLFAKIDFHHIAANVPTLGVNRAFEQVQNASPDYAGYVWWFLQQRSINAGRPEADEKIRLRLRELDWPV